MSGLVTLPVRQGTPEWLAMRRTGVTASEMPVIAGNRPGLVELWAYKSGLIEREAPDAATQELFDLGHALEPVISDMYTRRTGRPLRRVSQMVRHAGIDWLFASLDRVSAVRGERLVVELKFSPHRRWDDGAETVPADVQDQVQTQLLVTGWPMAHVAVLLGGRLDWHEVPADPDYQAALLTMAQAFRAQVLSGTRPTIDGSESTRRALARMHPRETLDLIEPTPEIDALAADLRVAKAAATAAKDEEDRLANVLRAVLGDHEGVDADTYRLTWRATADVRKTDWKALSADLAALVDNPGATDALATFHTTTAPGTRRLVTRFQGDDGRWM